MSDYMTMLLCGWVTKALSYFFQLGVETMWLCDYCEILFTQSWVNTPFRSRDTLLQTSTCTETGQQDRYKYCTWINFHSQDYRQWKRWNHMLVIRVINVRSRVPFLSVHGDVCLYLSWEYSDVILPVVRKHHPTRALSSANHEKWEAVTEIDILSSRRACTLEITHLEDEYLHFQKQTVALGMALLRSYKDRLHDAIDVCALTASQKTRREQSHRDVCFR